MGICVNFFRNFLGFGSFGARGVNFLSDFSQGKNFSPCEIKGVNSFVNFLCFGAKFAEFLSENSGILQKKREFFAKFTQIRVNLLKNSAQMLNFKGGAKWQD